MKEKLRRCIIVLCIIPIMTLILGMAGVVELSYSQLIRKIDNREVKTLHISNEKSIARIILNEEEEEIYWTSIANLDVFISFLNDAILDGNEIEVYYEVPTVVSTKKESSISFDLLVSLAILFVIIIVAIRLTRNKEQKEKSNHLVYNGNKTVVKVKFEDVAGIEEVKNEVIEIVEFLKNPNKFKEVGAKIPKGVLLCGPPGTGKTLLAKAIAGEAGVEFISASGSDFIEMYVGVGASRIRDLFKEAKSLSPCIIFIDEIDSVGGQRNSIKSGSDSESNQTLNQLLTELDGFESESDIVIIGATNRAEHLDDALLRPGRFDRKVYVGLPDIVGRLSILKVHSKNKKLSSDVNLEKIAKDTIGCSGAELANILNESAIRAVIQENKVISNSDIEYAWKKIKIGLQKSSTSISKEDRLLTAYHEAGHAIVGSCFENKKVVSEISIIPRGTTGGYTMYSKQSESMMWKKSELKEEIIVLLGGRAAEEIIFNDISSGAQNDIQVATSVAKNMIMNYGMGEKLLNIYQDNYVYYQEEVEEEVKLLIDDGYSKALEILKEKKATLDVVANALIEKETLSSDEFRALL